MEHHPTLHGVLSGVLRLKKKKNNSSFMLTVLICSALSSVAFVICFCLVLNARSCGAHNARGSSTF